MAAYFTPHFINPTGLLIELAYSAFVIVICLIIYFKTKKIYSLTGHEGMHYFRDTFLLFALAYLLRLVFSLIILSKLTFDIELLDIRMGMTGPLIFLLMGYISTAAILSLTMSTLWKKIKISKFVVHLISLGVSCASVFSRSFFILPVSQLILLVLALAGGYSKYRQSKKFPQTFLIYALLLLFWVMNLFALNFRGQHAPFEFRIPVYLISIAIFGFILYKINNSIK